MLNISKFSLRQLITENSMFPLYMTLFASNKTNPGPERNKHLLQNSDIFAVNHFKIWGRIPWTLLSLYVPLAAAQGIQFPVLKTEHK